MVGFCNIRSPQFHLITIAKTTISYSKSHLFRPSCSLWIHFETLLFHYFLVSIFITIIFITVIFVAYIFIAYIFVHLIYCLLLLRYLPQTKKIKIIVATHNSKNYTITLCHGKPFHIHYTLALTEYTTLTNSNNVI